MRALPCLLLALVTGCPSAPVGPTPAPPTDAALVVHAPWTGDATVAAVDPTTLEVTDGLLGLQGSDWGISGAGGDAWVLGRFGIDSVRRYAGADLSAPRYEVSTGAGSNPHALALCSDSAWVSRYDVGDDGGGDVLRLDPATGARIGAIDLGLFVESGDGTPEPDGLVVVGDSVFVALQRLDRGAGWVPDPRGAVVEIGCASGEIGASWDTGPNPSIHDGGDHIAVTTDEGLQRLDPDALAVTDLAALADFGAGAEIVVGASFEGAALAVVERDGLSNEVWCRAETDWQVIGERAQRAWSITTDGAGAAWIAWRDHWATAEVEPGGLSVVDLAGCTTRPSSLVAFSSDPATVALLGAAR